MIVINEKQNCCGCNACYSVCPKKAINMVEDEKGFKYPSIDKSKCINCGLCEKACPIINNKKESKKKIISYACYNKNEKERINSSSGGIFILIAKEIIKRGGVVFGACFNEKFEVVHSYVEKEEDVIKLMGSKYVQSDINDTYMLCKKFLNDGRYVLFTGTPCQIEGLKSFLKVEYSKLFTQDIICHGVPSPNLWKKYKDYREEKSKKKIMSISFRNKDKSWSFYRMKIIFTNKKYSKDLQNDEYLRLFLQNICLRDSCYNCSFKKIYRVSDFTLADYWGIDKIHRNMNDDKGTSLVLVNSIKGEKLFNSIKENIVCIKTVLDKAIAYNPTLIVSSRKDKNYDSFFNNIDNLSINELNNTYTNKTSIYRKMIKFFKVLSNKKKRLCKRTKI